MRNEDGLGKGELEGAESAGSSESKMETSDCRESSPGIKSGISYQ